MSVENHPNINAAGLTADVLQLILRHARGNAKLAGDGAVISAVSKIVVDFAVDVSETLDNTYGS